MAASVRIGERRSGAFILADISGYTSFLQGVADAHHALVVEADVPPPAYAVLSSLLDAIVAGLDPAFRLAKLEGDAVFAVGDDPGPTGDTVLLCLRACYAAFRAAVAGAQAQWTCSCDACARVETLDLKFIVHHGGYVAQAIAGREELLGPDVNLVHRLLKNHARDVVGRVPYALLTDAAVRAMEVPVAGMVALEERYDDTPAIPAHVLVLA